jgi:hypothetical protein
MEQEKNLSEKESLALITQMINKAKNSYYDTGIGSIMWGCVVAIMAIVKWCEYKFNFSLPIDISYLSLAAIIPQIFITLREKKERKVKSYDDVAMDYIWLGFGIALFLLIHVNSTLYNATAPLEKHSSFRYYEFISPLFLILYGLPTFITGAMFKFWPMFWGGIFCWVCSVVTVYTHIGIDLLLTAASAIFAWLIPGIIMEREYKRAKRAGLLNV